MNNDNRNKTFQDVVNSIRQMSSNEKIKGDIFEILCKNVIEISDFFNKCGVEKVWLWKDFPYNNNEVDTGIDLVAYTQDNEYWSIQCKCYIDTQTITKRSLDSFLARTNKGFRDEKGIKRNFDKKYLFYTNEKNFSKNANDYQIIKFGPNEFENCGIDWNSFDLKQLSNLEKVLLINKKNKELREHQQTAIKKCLEGFENKDRGQLIMACGSGKTFTSLRFIEEYVKKHEITNARILYLVPSISLLSQTAMEYGCQTNLKNLKMFGICSDASSVSKRKLSNDDEFETEIPIPATTNDDELCNQIEKYKNNHIICFSTYQSIDVVSRTQNRLDFWFDIVICDEAHRTIGSIKKEENENIDEKSNFVKVHDNTFIKAKKRLYMTATPKIYSSDSKEKHNENGYEVISMDDEEIFGSVFYTLTFGDAISKGLLCDYKLIVMNINKNDYDDPKFLKQIKSKELNDASKIFGVISALSKKTIKEQINVFEQDPKPISRAVAFTKTIKQAEFLAQQFNNLSQDDNYLKLANENEYIIPNAKYIIGKENSSIKNEKLGWLRENFEKERESRILTNARCLSEGVDVPSLDAVIFFSKRESKSDIIQAIGRVMRKPNNLNQEKKYGYIIIPVILESDNLTEEVIAKHQDYRLVLSVIQSLRSHDNRLDEKINQMGLTSNLPANICIINSFKPRIEGNVLNYDDGDNGTGNQQLFSKIDLNKLKENENLFRSFLIKKVGNRLYWENWSKDIGETVNKIVEHIKNEINNSETKDKHFSNFLSGLRDIINPSVSKDDAINMLAQHIVVLPVLEIIFGQNELVNKNSVFKVMQEMNNKLENTKSYLQSLNKLYESVSKQIAENSSDSSYRQSLIKTLFENFFKYAVPRDAEKFGIVYTPIEIVDFIINSVSDVLEKEFNESILNRGIKILDPFTGTGTFITRLLEKFHQLKATNEQITYKYQNDIWCNEIMLLAYYISLINIEDTYNRLTDEFLPFEHDVFADTFQMYESKNSKDSQVKLIEMEEFNNISQKMKDENEQDIRIIIGNPPYSVGQKTANDNNANNKYENLEQKIKETYLKDIKSNLKKALYDSYIKAFRWASDRIGNNGIISFVTNGGYVENASFEGFRRELLKEFNSIYVYDLKGEFRKYNKDEGENVFGSGCGTKVTIILLIKNEDKPKDNFINYLEIGSCLRRKKKLEEIKKNISIYKIKNWIKIYPDKFNDWINQRNSNLENLLKIGNKNNEESIFNTHYSLGISTGKNIWHYNFCLNQAILNDQIYANKYKEELDKWNLYKSTHNIKNNIKPFTEFVDNDPTKISWIDDVRNLAIKNIRDISNKVDYRVAFTSPFTKKYLDYNKKTIARPCKWENIKPNNDAKNIIINVTWIGHKNTFAALATNQIIDLHYLSTTASFPLYWYESQNYQSSLFDNADLKHSTIDDNIVLKFRNKYDDLTIKDIDIFNYIYGLLHSDEFKKRYSESFQKTELRIPFLQNFWSYSKVGSQLINLHLNYENLDSYRGVQIFHKNKLINDISDLPINDFYVEKMKLVDNKTTIIFNKNFSIKNIPIAVHDYLIINKSPLEWIINEYQYSQDTKSKIINDPNKYDLQKGGKYIFDLILSLITLSLETLKLIDELPEYEEI